VPRSSARLLRMHGCALPAGTHRHTHADAKEPATRRRPALSMTAD
jgi:hypothetical protein